MVAIKTFIHEIRLDMEYFFSTDDAPKGYYDNKNDELIQLLSCGCFDKTRCSSGSISNAVDYEDEILRRVTSWLSREDYSQAGTSIASRGTVVDEFNEYSIDVNSPVGSTRGRLRRVRYVRLSIAGSLKLRFMINLDYLMP